jgi:hypothetical protein
LSIKKEKKKKIEQAMIKWIKSLDTVDARLQILLDAGLVDKKGEEFRRYFAILEMYPNQDSQSIVKRTAFMDELLVNLGPRFKEALNMDLNAGSLEQDYPEEEVICDVPEEEDEAVSQHSARSHASSQDSARSHPSWVDNYMSTH